MTAACAWDRIDLGWMMKTYPEMRDILVRAEAVTFAEALVLAGRFGYSPNPFFDEAYYVSRYPDVWRAINEGVYVSGFDHYRSVGYREQYRNPHWLFSEEYYLARNDDVALLLMNGADFRNGYDHYIRVGDGEFRSGSWFFEPLPYVSLTGCEAATAPFQHCLGRRLSPGSGYSSSAYFNGEWYATAYTDAPQAVRRGEWISVLHHYLGKRHDGRCDPSRFFSEEFYVAANPDLLGAIETGRFLSGYEHFLLYGIRDRRAPRSDVDLERFYHQPYVQRLLLNGRVPDVFVAWCIFDGVVPDVEAVLEDAEKISRFAFEKKSAALAINASRRKLDFSFELPDASVILLLHNNFDMTMNTLTALRMSHAGGIHLILVDNGSSDETRHIERYVDGATLLRFGGNVTFARACNEAARHAMAPYLLFLDSGAEILSGSIAVAMKRLRRDQKVGVIGGKLLGINGLLQDAGSIIYRDGSAEAYMRDRSPDVPEANFVRCTDFCSGACLFTRTELFRQVGGFYEAFVSPSYEDADYCVRVWKLGQEVIYDPSVTAIRYEYGLFSSESRLVSTNRNHAIFNLRHADFLVRKLAKSRRGINAARSPVRSGARRILFIEDRIPLKQKGSGLSRAHDIVVTFAEMGHEVTVFPIFKSDVSPRQLYAAFPENVEVIWDREMHDLEEFLHQRAGLYDAIWICRSQNMSRLVPTIERSAHLMPQAMIVADIEAVRAVGEEQRDRLLGLPETEQSTLADRLRAEFQGLMIATKIVAASARDVRLLTGQGFTNVSVLGQALAPRPTPKSWSERSGFLFVGTIQGQASARAFSFQSGSYPAAVKKFTHSAGET
ncbi:GT2 family glycosyltransferase [Acidomonas methanolica]|nr:GT2 family glycosyltransferase [Acidomonas methanolica]